MIIIVTLNVALDISYAVAGVVWDGLNRVPAPVHRAAGRGVTVARVLHTFGHEVSAAGLVGGASGELIRSDLASSGVPTDFTRTGRESRRVIWVTDTKRGETACFREPAPFITTEELGRFAADYRRLLKDATGVVLCGSLAAGLPPDIYGTLATYAADVGVPVVLHAGGAALRFGVVRRPALVVPDIGFGDSLPFRPRELVAAGVGAVVVPAPNGVRAISAGGGWRAYGVPVSSAHAWPGDAPRTRAALPGVQAGIEPSGPPGAGPAAPGGSSRSAPGGPARAVPAKHARAEGPAAPPSLTHPHGQPGSAEPSASGWSSEARGALVAGLVPGLLLGWSWPDRLRHALALAAAVDPVRSVDIAAYERFIPQIVVERE